MVNNSTSVFIDYINNNIVFRNNCIIINIIQDKFNNNTLIESSIININHYISMCFKYSEIKFGRVTREVCITLVSYIYTVVTCFKPHNLQLTINNSNFPSIITSNRSVWIIINSNNNFISSRNTGISIINIINSERYVYSVVKCNICHRHGHISTCFRYSEIKQCGITGEILITSIGNINCIITSSKFIIINN